MKSLIIEAQRLQKLAGINEIKVVPASLQNLFGDFSHEGAIKKTDSINRFARTISELIEIVESYEGYTYKREIDIAEIFNYDGMNDIEDGDTFYTGPSESVKIFKSLPSTFIVSHNMNDMISYEINKTGDTTFKYKIISK